MDCSMKKERASKSDRIYDLTLQVSDLEKRVTEVNVALDKSIADNESLKRDLEESRRHCVSLAEKGASSSKQYEEKIKALREELRDCYSMLNRFIRDRVSLDKAASTPF